MSSLHDLQNRNETIGERRPTESKYNAYRAAWLRERFYRDHIPAAYFHNEYRQFPESIKKEVESSVFAVR